ncbi:glycosyltransferase family 2 protein (plasmid) [Paroceanicella profunda]|uniref:Glycosyltransferase family 2 protein n=1 Tax=Paroceanicella profunda TaxID=2579971 RepID=A0A5B8G3Y4_9RHOB|nr:glycosyltransferase family 2 protein [Paroceanicella profunda]QDL94700.1 glycosyltransferase family 2 protein [Paroceanicella profunda]
MSKPESPRISCVLTAFNEGPLASVSIKSLLSQTFGDFEILIVDDGASEETRETLHSFKDDRILHIRQANDGLSSARNRALNVARGDYVCFLDADDTRPIWAFETMMAAAQEDVDVVFSPGVLQEVRMETGPFYDQSHFDRLQMGDMAAMTAGNTPRLWISALRELACVEPQCANKMVRRAFLEKHKLRFPAGLFFEDMILHYGLLANMRSYALTELPTFTYFRRYGRPQITSGTSTTRFDAISTATNALHLFSFSEYFQDVVLRSLVLASAFKLLKWCEESVSHDHAFGYGEAIGALVNGLDQRYLKPLDENWAEVAYQYAPWVQPSLQYVASRSGRNR